MVGWLVLLSFSYVKKTIFNYILAKVENRKFSYFDLIENTRRSHLDLREKETIFCLLSIV